MSLSNSIAARAPLLLTARRDLVVRQQRFQGRPCWTVKDPISLKYFQLAESEYFILGLLDGRRSVADIQELYEERFAPARMNYRFIMDFASSMHQDGLATSIVGGQAALMQARQDQRLRRQMWEKSSNILAVRFRGVDPDRWLNRTYPLVRWAFSRAALTASLLLGLAALTLIVVQFESFQSRLPAFQQFFTRENAVCLAAVLVGTKICHELGHAYACKHFGGECHEIGLLLLVFSPCLYCNVSDSWMLRNKWHRMAIGAAGMYVELVIASLATFTWWFSQPGLLNNLCLSAMFICSVGTVLFNANPLLRYDGYYILADYLEIPNLRQKSSDVLHRASAKFFLRIDPPQDPFLPRRGLWRFAAFTVASEVYRWLVTFVIIAFLYSCLEPYRLKVLGQLLGGVAVFALLVQPVWRLLKFMRVPKGADEVSYGQFWQRMGLIVAAVLMLLVLPLPHRVRCTLELQPRDAVPVYVESPGELAAMEVRGGQRVAPGQPLARLENIDLELAVAELTRKRDRQQVQWENLRRMRHQDGKVAEQLPELAKSLDSTSRQLRERESDMQRLLLTSPVAGTVISPPGVRANPADEHRLPAWDGTLFESRNAGSFLEVGTLLCHVGDPHRLWADLVVDQAEIEFVAVGQIVTLKFDGLPQATFRGLLSEISGRDLQATPRQLSNRSGGELASRNDEAGRERPLSATYQVRVAVDDPAGMLLAGYRGRAKIHVPAQSLGQAAWRWCQKSFHFSL